MCKPGFSGAGCTIGILQISPRLSPLAPTPLTLSPVFIQFCSILYYFYFLIRADICAAARCGPHGTCSARFLGGDLWVADAACACEAGWTGPTCEANPCNGVTCNGRGSCVANGESDYTCQCKDGYYGKDCLNCM